MESIRISLPGYDALTDTNLDHFSLHGDEDNILIKRKLQGTATIADGSPTILTIPHNLGYIPFFMVHYYDEIAARWQILNNHNDAFSVPQQLCAVDTTNLYIYNFGGHGSGHIQVVYDIFYDNMNDNTAPSITESDDVFKVSRPGKNALTSKNPNDYIMHSDLNNFKILKEGIYASDWNGLTSITIPHGANVQAPYKYFLFINSDNDGKTILVGGTSATKTYDGNQFIFTSSMDATNIYITFPLVAISTAMTVKFYIYGTGKDNTVIDTNPLIAVTPPGKNVLTETNPDNYNFHSNYPTLKYYFSDVYSMTVSNSTVVTIPHNLGYIPFFIGFVKDLSGLVPGGYAIIPYYFGRSNVFSPKRDVAAFMYADDANIYLKAFYEVNAIGTSFTFIFYFKIFKNSLGI